LIRRGIWRSKIGRRIEEAMGRILGDVGERYWKKRRDKKEEIQK
jgi:hypothetical protein